ncbi:MAG: hypothetical protein QOK11_2529 [Pseudonocardiales bacterium]|nr:hypothetical protein [Pseudonocardiales bacterium]
MSGLTNRRYCLSYLTSQRLLSVRPDKSPDIVCAPLRLIKRGYCLEPTNRRGMRRYRTAARSPDDATTPGRAPASKITKCGSALDPYLGLEIDRKNRLAPQRLDLDVAAARRDRLAEAFVAVTAVELRSVFAA